MKKEQKLATSLGVAGVLYIEEGLLWFLDRIIDIGLVYKDTIISYISSI